VVAQAALSQVKGAHAVVTGAGQLPMPSQADAAVATPAAHDAARQLTIALGKVHRSRTVPSQLPAQGPLPAQAVRAPRGAPAMPAQVPCMPGTSHASHWPLQAVLQQKPSTQLPDAHWLLAVQVDPGGVRGTHIIAALQ
jgi:hypothetical protein